MLLDCTGCHTLERVVRSTHDADEWTQVVRRMKGYAFVSTPIKPQRMLDETRAGKPEDYRKIAEYLATINLSAVDRWEYPLKTLPRPSGRATRAIVTEYDMKRPTTQPHDVLLDKDGNVWYSDFGELFISKFDPKTLKLTEYPTTEFKPGAPVGNLSLEFDKEGKLWFDTMHQGAIGTHRSEDRRDQILSAALRNGTTTASSSISSACAMTSTARYGPRTSARSTFSGSISPRANGSASTRPNFSPPGHRYSIYQLISELLEQCLGGRIRGWLSRQDRCEDAQGDVVSVAFTPRARAPNGDRRSGPHPGDRVSGQQGRTLRHEDRAIHRIRSAAVDVPLPGAGRQEWRALDRRHELRPRGTS